MNERLCQALMSVAFSVTLAACGRESDAAQRPAHQTAPAQTAAPQTAADSVRFVQHGEHVPPGFPLGAGARFVTLRSPAEGNARAAELGKQLFVAYNCVDCHGADGSGAMGPSLADGRWHFGGSPGEVFESIYQGRPDGMPAWGGRIADEQIWQLVAYVRSLSAGKQVSTENFTGKAIERMGH